jgi:hypothetical protein
MTIFAEVRPFLLFTGFIHGYPGPDPLNRFLSSFVIIFLDNRFSWPIVISPFRDGLHYRWMAARKGSLTKILKTAQEMSKTMSLGP